MNLYLGGVLTACTGQRRHHDLAQCLIERYRAPRPERSPHSHALSPREAIVPDLVRLALTEVAILVPFERAQIGSYGAVFRATRSDRCCSELSRWSCPNGGNWRYSRTWGGTADQSYVSVTVVRDGPVASRS